MMVQMYPSLPRDISFLTGKGYLNRNIPVQPAYNMLRHIRASSILGFHDQTYRIGHVWTVCRENQRIWCFRVFMGCDDDILNDLKYLEHRYLSQEEYDRLERLVCQLYKYKVYIYIHKSERASVVLVLQPRSWGGDYVFPPTTGSPTLHIQRAHYVPR